MHSALRSVLQLLIVAVRSTVICAAIFVTVTFAFALSLGLGWSYATRASIVIAICIALVYPVLYVSFYLVLSWLDRRRTQRELARF